MEVYTLRKRGSAPLAPARLARRALSCPFAPTTPRPSPRPSLKTPPRSPSLTRRVSPLSGGLGHADPAQLPSSPYSSADPTGFVSGRKPLGLRPDPPCLPFRPLSHLTSLPSARRASARHKLFILDILAHKPITAGLGDCTKPFARNLLQLGLPKFSSVQFGDHFC